MQRDFNGMDTVYTSGTPGNMGVDIIAGATVDCQAIGSALGAAFAP